jgi:ADP-ribosylation factor-like protein 4
MNILRKRNGRLSASYSALDSVSLESSDSTSAAGSTSLFVSPPAASQKSVSDCVKNVAKWVSTVGDKVGKGTTALIDSLPSMKEDHHVVMIGLDGAGKTTVLYRLKFDQYVSTVPTIGFNCERVRGTAGTSRGLTFLVWDVGGQEKLRPLWRPYTRATDGVIFVVDSTDPPERLEEARLELHAIMARTRDNVNVPLLVVANKQDLPTAKSTSELETALGLSDLKQLHHVEAVCAVTGEGLDVAVEQLHELIVKRKKLNKRERNKTR